jgi:hypothetical protein
LSIVSVNFAGNNSVIPVGAQTIAAVPTPKSPQDSTDQVLSSLSSLKSSTTNNGSGGAIGLAKNVQIVAPVVPGLLSVETIPPRAVNQPADDPSLSGSGNRSRW